jgi:TonB family protein
VHFDLPVSVAKTIAVVSVVIGGYGCNAVAGEVGRKIHFDIPSQSLSAALRAFSAATGSFGVYDGRLIAPMRSVALIGAFSPDAGLAVLLDGSGLVGEYTSSDAFVVVAPRGGNATLRSAEIASAALSSMNDPEQRYAAHLQESLEATLCSVPLTRPGDYRAAISVTINERGAVERVRLLSSTGDGRRDAAILAVGAQTKVGEPPPHGMKQPFAMVILPRQSGATLQCKSTLGRG